MRAPSLGLCCALLLPGAARAQESEPLDLAALYDHRFRFDGQGHPTVSVGLMDGQVEISLRSVAGLRVRCTEGSTEKILHIPAGRRVTVKILETSPARVRRWAVLETLEREERLHRQETLVRWQRSLREEVRGFEVGGVYGVEGTVVDNRASLVAAAPGREPDLEVLMQRLYEKTGVRPRIHEELLAPPHGRLVLVDDLGVTLAQPRNLLEVTAADDAVQLERVESAVGYKHHGFEDRAYAGRVVIAVDAQGKLSALNALEVDRLLKGIVPSEIFPNSPPDALKAQAVTARGEVFAKVGVRHLTDPYVLCDEQHCQVYSGTRAERVACSDAVDATRGEMAFLGGRLVDTVYSAMCGGRTEDNEIVWEVPPNGALRGRLDHEGSAELLAALTPPVERGGRTLPLPPPAPDPTRTVANPGLINAADLSQEGALREFLSNPPPAFCAQATLGKKDKFRWVRRIPVEEATERCRDLGVGDVTTLQVEARGRSGRVRTLKVAGRKGAAFVHRELPVRRLLGNLPSGMFVVDEERTTPDGPLVAFVLRGGGFGHGVGMCQTGAVGMAEAGHDYRAILQHYYNGAEVMRVY